MNKQFENIIVAGAGGKMGRGISLLLLQMMGAMQAQDLHNSSFKLYLYEIEEKRHSALKTYLEEQIQRYAEKEINKLRQWFINEDHLISNREIVDAFVEKCLEICHFTTQINFSINSALVFEAIAEDIDIKIKFFKELEVQTNKQFYYFTNTSSIPIAFLSEKAQIKGKIVGFHFYNPPPLQKLVEIIIPKNTDPQLVSLAEILGELLNKHLVPSNDIAGFIGNGFMVRQIAYACSLVNELPGKTDDKIWMIDTVSRDYLLRPMGIFQLIDYVGINICHQICIIMEAFLPQGKFLPLLIEQMDQEGVLGGQDMQGKQKNGFFAYQQDKIVAVYNPETGDYIPLENNKIQLLQKNLGERTQNLTWKQLLKNKKKNELIQNYFKELMSQKNLGADIVRKILHHEKEIISNLVESGVAQNIKDVNDVLRDGFYHLYTLSEVGVQ